MIIFFKKSVWPHHTDYRILLPQQGIEPQPLTVRTSLSGKFWQLLLQSILTPSRLWAAVFLPKMIGLGVVI